MKKNYFWTLSIFLLVSINMLIADNWVYNSSNTMWEKNITPDMFLFANKTTTQLQTNIHTVTGGGNPTPAITSSTGQNLTDGYFAVSGGQVTTTDTDPVLTNTKNGFNIINTTLGSSSGNFMRFASSAATITFGTKTSLTGYFNLNWYIPTKYNYTGYLISFTDSVYNPATYNLQLLVYDETGSQQGSTQTQSTTGWNIASFTQNVIKPFRFKMSIPNTSGLICYYTAPKFLMKSATEPTVRTITVNKTGAGNVTATYATVRDQDIQIFTITPLSGQSLLSTTYNGVTVTPVDNLNGTYTYTTPLLTSNGTLNVNFSYIQASTAGANISSKNYNEFELANTDLTVTVGEFIIDVNSTMHSLIVAPGAKLTINSGNSLTASNGLTLQSSSSGTATMLNSGTLTGTVTAQQYFGTARNWYLTSPLSAATSPATNITRYYEYVEAGTNADLSVTGSTAYWKGLNTGYTMAVGKGYIAQASAETTVSFSGTPNNGDITTTFDLTRDDAKGKGFNLVGNPYPSYIDWTKVATANTNLDNTYYYRTKNTNVTNTYTFVTWNGAGSGSYVVSNGSLPANTSITRFIPPTQAFWVRVKLNSSPTKMYFNNGMREHRDDDYNLMKARKQDSRTSLRLQLHNGTDSDEMLVYFDGEANNNYDAFDSPKMMNNSATVPDLYSKVDNERLVINGLNSISDNTELPLGFSLNAAATLKLKATQLSNFPVGTRVYLLDKDVPSQTELLPETEYSFTTTAPTANNENRFSLLFKAPSISTGTTNPANENVSVFVNSQKEIVINAKAGSNYAIYNAVGQQIFTGKTTSNIQTTNHKQMNGVYVVKVGNLTKRVIIK